MDEGEEEEAAEEDVEARKLTDMCQSLHSLGTVWCPGSFDLQRDCCFSVQATAAPGPSPGAGRGDVECCCAALRARTEAGGDGALVGSGAEGGAEGG